MSESPEQINQFLDYIFTWGPFWVYLVIFAACFIENLFPPFPGDSFIIAAGGIVGLGRLDLMITFAVVVVGGMASVMLLYLIGRRYGREFFIRKDYKYFTVGDIELMERRFSRWGGLILVVSRFVVGMRAALGIAAGISRYGAVRMFVFSTVSYFLFAGLLMYAAIKLVENYDRIEYFVRTYNRIVWPVVIVIVAAWIYRIIKTHRGKVKQ